MAPGDPRRPLDEYERETRYVTAADGTQIAWHVHRSAASVSKSAPTVLLTNGVFTTENFWKHVVRGLAQRFRVVHWDYRGHGQSGLAVGGDYSQATLSDDLRRVTEAVVERDGAAPIHVAFSMGVSVLLELYRQSPELVPAMTLIAGSPDGPFSYLLNVGLRRRVASLMGWAEPLVPAIAPLFFASLRTPIVYPAGRLLGVLRARAPRAEVEVLLHSLSRMEPRACWRILRGYLVQEGADVLPTIRVPTLVLAAEHDVFMPRKQVDVLEQRIPNVRFAVIRDSGHATLTEAGAEVAERIATFLEALPSR